MVTVARSNWVWVVYSCPCLFRLNLIRVFLLLNLHVFEKKNQIGDLSKFEKNVTVLLFMSRKSRKFPMVRGQSWNCQHLRDKQQQQHFDRKPFYVRDRTRFRYILIPTERMCRTSLADGAKAFQMLFQFTVPKIRVCELYCTIKSHFFCTALYET